MTTVRAAFLDLDGVLIDSMSAHAQAWLAMLRENGIEEKETLFYEREGEKSEDTLTLVLKRHNVSLPVKVQRDMVERKRSIYRDLAPRGLRGEARELVEALRAREIQCMIVTGSNRRNFDSTVPPDEQALFQAIITADDYARGKPEPDPYLAAWRISGVRKEECLALENAPLGIRSAKAAGLKTIAIITSLPAEYLTEADAIIESFPEFLNFV